MRLITLCIDLFILTLLAADHVIRAVIAFLLSLLKQVTVYLFGSILLHLRFTTKYWLVVLIPQGQVNPE